MMNGFKCGNFNSFAGGKRIGKDSGQAGKAWKQAAHQPQMIEAQNEVIDEEYWNPAVCAVVEDGLSPLGLYIYYDCLVVHGPGEETDSFGEIRNEAKENCLVPSGGGDERTYLQTFLDVRETVMLKEEAHQDLSRIEVQRKFIQAKKWELSLPLEWTMYGDRFSLP